MDDSLLLGRWFGYRWRAPLLTKGLLECPHAMVTGIAPSKGCKGAKWKLTVFDDDVVLEATVYHFCNILPATKVNLGTH